MSTQQVWLITGATRGIGKGLVTALLQRPETTVIAGTRDLASTNSKQLNGLPHATGSRVIVVKIDSESDDDAQTAVATLQKEHNLDHIDVVIANAATLAPLAPTTSASIEDFRKSYQVNTFSPLLLFQATWPLLEKSKAPKFIGITTSVATIGKMGDWPVPTGVYGSSKAAMNYIVKKMHHENENLVAFVVHPGSVCFSAPGSASMTF